jgi:hypothetical protein
MDIYIGAADNIQTALLQLLQGAVPCVLENNPTWFSYSLTHEGERLGQQFVNELDPVCNRRVGNIPSANQPE